MRALCRVLLVAVVFGVGALALPAGVGGATVYVRSYGNSMEPMLRTGDLAVVRSARSYGIGDVVAYRSPELGHVVLHRIVARDGDTFVFRGDNNGFPDVEHLGAEHILGRLALRVPRGGAVVLWLGNPVHAVGLAAAASVVPGVLFRRRRRRRSHPQPIRGRSMNANKVVAGCRAAAPWVAVVGAVLVLVGGIALGRPSTRVVDEPAAFTHNGSFTYAAPPAPPLYPDGFVTGDPVFTRLADRVTVRFAYSVDSDAVVALDSTVRVDAILSGAAGWKRVVPLLGPRPLEPGATDVEVALHLPTLRALGAEADVITGAAAGGLVVGVTPSVDFDGAVAGQDVAGRFAPALDFTLDGGALRLVTPVPGDGDERRIERTQAGAVDVPTSQATKLSLPLVGREVAIGTARIAGLGGGVALLLVAGALAWAGRRRDDGDAARIAARYGHLLIPISADAHDDRPMVDVSTIDDLVRLAGHHEQLVTHHVDGDAGCHTYVVSAQGRAYRYRETAPASGPPT